MDSSPVSMLPRGFDYYAGGHVHIIKEESLPGYKNIVYPGPLFPNSFRELEELKCGGFYIYDNGSMTYRPLQIVNVFSIAIDCSQKTPEQVEAELRKETEKKEFVNTIVTIRLEGTLKSGKISEINLKDIFTELYEKSAFFVMHSTSGLATKEFEEIKVSRQSVEDVEDALIREHIGQSRLGIGETDEIGLVKELIRALNIEKQEGEKSADYEARIKKDAVATLNLKEDFS
jgi:DNA repair exonuclease SbcCD nuclease subunit